jgi:hypothetical protein
LRRDRDADRDQYADAEGDQYGADRDADAKAGVHHVAMSGLFALLLRAGRGDTIDGRSDRFETF